MFLLSLVPALERRLAQSPLAGHTGELRLSFYRDGVKLMLENGRVKATERWRPSLTLLGQEMGVTTMDARNASSVVAGSGRVL